MPHCYVVNCKNYYEKTRGTGKVSYHMPPAAPGVAAKWAKACTGTAHTPPKYMRVCSEHFSERCYLRDLQHELLGLPLRKKLKGDAVPDLNLPAIFKIPMRSSVRIARRETVGCLADLQSPKVKKRNGRLLERERFLRKIKYMRQLKLNFQKNVAAAAATPKTAEDGLNKMHVMEDVREACETQPSSPGHAEQRADVAESAPASEDEKDDKEDEEKNEEESEQQSSPKRKSCGEETPVKKVKNDLQQEFYLRNKILSEYTDSLDMSSFDQIQSQTEQLITEIQNLADLAKEKEREWNNVIQVKKMKEELLIRIQRQKQVCLLSNGLEISESEPEGDPKQKLLQRRRNEINRQKLMKTLQNNLEMNGHDGKAKQRPVRDVQSIIADYRQRHPETVPRRGRRIRTVNGQDTKNGGVINFANMALGTGSQVRQNNNVFDAQNELGLFLSAMESVDQGDGVRQLQSSDASFKDILVRFAKLSQSERHELLQNVIKPPPPYPEVTVHPVAVAVASSPQHNNSLLHGILTKTQSKQDNKSSFSPTLARLLTAPERSVASQQQQQGQVSVNNNTTSNNNNNNRTAANVSISDILNSNKARNEITITPVGGDYEASPKRKNNHTDEEEAEDSVDRLVIDESDDIVDARTDNNSDAGDEVPQCQGCNLKAAQFVCAGCGNQWYCSRECQVSAWDEHSEVCSG